MRAWGAKRQKKILGMSAHLFFPLLSLCTLGAGTGREARKKIVGQLLFFCSFFFLIFFFSKYVTFSF
jgi:hypothetical protein